MTMTWRETTRVLGVGLAVCLGWFGFAITANPPVADNAASRSPIRKLHCVHLPNGLRLCDKVISGGQPEGEAAFAQLRRLGVKTIISVDGARPDVAGAKKYGLRYVHLPHGYDGISPERLKELAKAVHEFPGPIYIHCHHGRHRSPAAAAAICVSLGTMNNKDALDVLKLAGTSPSYRGLYESVAAARPLDPEVLDRLAVEYRGTADVPPLAEAMVAIEHIHDRLVELDKAGWKTPRDDPDSDAAHQALLLKEQFTELKRSEATRGWPSRFLAMLREGCQGAARLETALRASPPDQTVVRAALGRITANCQQCHRAFRDVPLREPPAATTR